MPITCFTNFIVDPVRLSIIIFSLSLAVTIFVALRKFTFSRRSRIALIYGHLVLLFFPLLLYSTHIGCGMVCASCYYNPLHLLGYTLTTALIASSLTGFVAIPLLYTFYSRKIALGNNWMGRFMDKHSRKLGIKTPRLYMLDDAKPTAFSFKSLISAVFVSMGLTDILNRKETEAVLLHELSHVKGKSSILKFSDHVMRFMSPLSLLAGFNHNTCDEERQADDFVVRVQATDKYLLSAKRKLDDYEKARSKRA